jgi:hypothetical protein
MESKPQTSESKTALLKEKNGSKQVHVRVSLASKKIAIGLLGKANSKKFGRKIKFDALFDLALTLVTSEHLKVLQEQSMTNEDRKEILRQKYVEKYGSISKDDFTGFMMKPEYIDFLNQI